MQKIIVPTYIEYNACQLTIDNLNNFKKFISNDAYNIFYTFKEMKDRQIPMEVSFKWNPHGDDYPDTVSVKLNQYFLYDVEEPNHYLVIDAQDIREEWYIHEN